MDIVRNPQKYGQEAEMGIFIPLEELAKLGGAKVLDRFEKIVRNTLGKAEKQLEFYQDLQDSGEATARQQTSLIRWEQTVHELKESLSSIIEAEKRLETMLK